MEQLSQNGARFIDVTGLGEESIRALESQVAALKEISNANKQRHSHVEWSKEFHEWVESHSTDATFADWSRESIYGDRDE